MILAKSCTRCQSKNLICCHTPFESIFKIHPATISVNPNYFEEVRKPSLQFLHVQIVPIRNFFWYSELQLSLTNLFSVVSCSKHFFFILLLYCSAVSVYIFHFLKFFEGHHTFLLGHWYPCLPVFCFIYLTLHVHPPVHAATDPRDASTCAPSWPSCPLPSSGKSWIRHWHIYTSVSLLAADVIVHMFLFLTLFLSLFQHLSIFVINHLFMPSFGRY